MVSGCGSRLTRAEILSANLTAGKPEAASSTETMSPARSAMTGTSPSGSEAGLPVAGSGADASPGDTGPTGGSSAEIAQVATGNLTPGDRAGGSNASGGPCAARAGPPIVVGFIGDLSGFGGSTGAPASQAWSVWAKMVDASGGIDCHPVKVLVADDGGSSANDVTIAQEFVSDEGAIALSVAVSDPTAIASWAQSHSIPVIGSELGGDVWHETPMLFPTFADSIAGVWGAARLARDDDITKVGSLYCVESPALCQTSNEEFVADAKADGLQVVYQGSISLTEPDYTANCLQAQSAGAQLLFIAADSNTIVRVAQSCARQAYDPVYDIPTGQDSMAAVPQLVGGISASQSFPWFLRQGGPGITEYVHALQTYAPSMLTDGYVSQSWGWVSAKVFQLAVAEAIAGDPPSAKVTTAEVLDGLWSMRDNTIDGLDPGQLARTFVRGTATPTTFCVISAKIASTGWVAPEGMTPVCQGS